MEPRKYRKKPVLIEAMGPLSAENSEEIAAWCVCPRCYVDVYRFERTSWCKNCGMAKFGTGEWREPNWEVYRRAKDVADALKTLSVSDALKTLSDLHYTRVLGG